MNDLVILKRQNKEDIPVTTSKIISSQTNNKHHTVTKLIQNHKARIEKFGILRFKIEEITGRGQPEKIYELNEQQATLLVTFMKNTDIVADFKVELVRQFYEIRKILQEKSSQEWQQARLSGKQFQKELNDTVQEFIEYASRQGSKSPKMYYMNFAKLSNRVVGIDNGSRDYAKARQLTIQTLIIDIIKSTIEEGMEEGLFYKDIFKLCKERTEEITSKVYLRLKIS